MTYPISEYGEIPALKSWELDELEEPDTDARELLAKTHRGFNVTCERCGSDAVGVDSDMGFSRLSGAWGGVYLRCAKCNLAVYVWEAV